MGTSTDAILAWGVDLQEEIPAWVWKAFNVVRRKDGDTEQLQKTMQDAGFELEVHCSDNCPMYVLCVAESVSRAYRGTPRPIKTSSMIVPEAWEKMWERFGRGRGAPQWLLFSWWS